MNVKRTVAITYIQNDTLAAFVERLNSATESIKEAGGDPDSIRVTLHCEYDYDGPEAYLGFDYERPETASETAAREQNELQQKYNDVANVRARAAALGFTLTPEKV